LLRKMRWRDREFLDRPVVLDPVVEFVDYEFASREGVFVVVFLEPVVVVTRVPEQEDADRIGICGTRRTRPWLCGATAQEGTGEEPRKKIHAILPIAVTDSPSRYFAAISVSTSARDRSTGPSRSSFRLVTAAAQIVDSPAEPSSRQETYDPMQVSPRPLRPRSSSG